MNRLLKTILYLILIISFFGCRKPKKGRYELKFTSQTGSVTSFTCDIYKEKRIHYILDIDKQYEGTLEFSENYFSGLFGRSDIGVSHNYSSSYELKGKSARKKLKGTYTYSSSWYSPPIGNPPTGNNSGSSTDKGVFEMILQE